jgi:hypothetical protein
MRFAFASLLLAFNAWAAGSPPKVARIDPPKRMLFLGNSFTYFNDGVPLHVKQLAIAGDHAHADAYAYKMATISGASLNELEPLVPSLLKENWDVVVLQGQSTEPIVKGESERFRAAVRTIDGAIRAAGAKSALYMTWAFPEKSGIVEQLSAAYLAAGDELGALVVPVGLAFERSKIESPSIDLYYVDKKHPSLEGTYLAACVFYAAFFGRSPEGNTYLAGLSVEVAHRLQQTAWDTAKAFYGAPQPQ